MSPTPSGILVLDKPRGWTSAEAVAFVRRRTGVKRVGHAGTLDPLATGVLPLLLGQATRLAEYLLEARKTYVAEVTLGVETNTYDAEGEVVRRLEARDIERGRVETALARFRGEFDQVPPAFSAVKQGGVPVYRLARRGQEVDLAPRRVVVQRLELTAFQPPLLVLEVECGKGFYVRSLAHDLGVVLGTGAMLSGLRRTRVGSFRAGDAIEPTALAAAIEAGTWQELLWAPDEVLLAWPAAILGKEEARRLGHGQALLLGAGIAGPRFCRAYSTDGDFLAVLGREQGGRWQPEKVFASE